MTSLLAAAFFVCPLIFFTDLTRNPYFTQIALLNILLLAAIAAEAVRSARKGEWGWPKTPLELPWLAWLGVALLTWGLGWLRHAPYFRPSIASEGWRVFQFTLINTFAAYWAGASLTQAGEDRPRPIAWLGLVFAFGAAWVLFPWTRTGVGPDASIAAHILDPYGLIVWGAGLAAATALARGRTASRLFHVALAAALLASVYGVLQYFDIEWIWPKVLNPYGGRSVSTFGNPNFLSSYVVLLAPVTFLHFLFDEKSRWVYAGALAAMWCALMASLTRSSWVGWAAGFAALAAWPRVRQAVSERRKPVLALAAALAAVAICWPRSPVEGYRATAVERLFEAAEAIKHDKPDQAYAPWHQRVLIWSCAWQMGLDAPLVGQGWGLLELLYPFYQGPLLVEKPIDRPLRTHANNAHNEALELFSQTGLLGLGISIWLWLSFFRFAASTWPRAGDMASGRVPVRLLDESGSPAFWSWGLAAGAAGVLVDNLMNVSMHFAVPAFALYWCVGAAAAKASRGERRTWRPGPALGWALAAAAVALCAAEGWSWVCQWEREAHYFTGFKLVRQNRLDAAARELQTAFDWNPREVNNDYELGNSLARLGRNEEAVRAYRAALDANAGYDEIYFNLATVLGPKMGRWSEAEDAYRTAVWINPLSKDAATGLATAVLREPKARFAEARALLEKEARLFPDDPSFPNNLGYLYSINGDTAAARGAYERSLRLDPDFQLAERNLRATLGPKAAGDRLLAALDERRELEKRIGEKRIDAETLRLAEDSATAFPGDLKARFYRGSLRLALNRPAEGLEDLAFVVERQPGNAAARVNYARALELTGKAEEARRQYEEALRIDPENGPARRALAHG